MIEKINRTKLSSYIKKYFLNEAYDMEIFNSCITLKNMAIVQQNKPMSGDYVIEKLMENSKLLRPIYGEMLGLYRRGENEVVFQLIYKKIGTKTSKNFAMILEKLDLINPVELIEQVMAFEEAMRENRVTKELKKADRNSIITTVCSTSIIFALLLNFAVVVVFMDTMRLLKEFM